MPIVLQDWIDFQKHKGDMDFVVNVQILSNNSYTNVRVIRTVFRVTVEAEEPALPVAASCQARHQALCMRHSFLVTNVCVTYEDVFVFSSMC